MKVKKVIVDEMPERCRSCPLEMKEYSDDCGEWREEMMPLGSQGWIPVKVPDSRCLCEVEGEK